MPDPPRHQCLKRAEADLAAAREAADQAPRPVRRVNVSDPDSRIVKTQKCWVQGYNAQAIASRDQIVVACEVSRTRATCSYSNR